LKRLKGLPSRKARFIKTILIVLAAMLVIAIGSIVAVRQIYHNNLKPVSNNQKHISITVPLGYSVQQIASLLKQQNLIRSTWAFEQYVRGENLQEKFKAGTYVLQASQSIPEIVDVLTQGKIQTDKFTVVPGDRIDEVRANLINSGYAEAEVDEALNPAVYRNHPALADMPSSVTSLEGYLYPETIHKNAATPPEDIIRLFLDEMQKRLTPEVRNGFVAQGLTVHQGIILASIVENEVPGNNPNERPQVAQVFLKRLHAGIKLESDATTSYGQVLELSPNPYNTYENVGLTPSPISSVTASSLQAVAAPASTNWLYFVSGKDCITRFSNTIGEHQKLIDQHGLSTQSDKCQ
jgi:UPF0755 protein